MINDNQIIIMRIRCNFDDFDKVITDLIKNDCMGENYCEAIFHTKNQSHQLKKSSIGDKNKRQDIELPTNLGKNPIEEIKRKKNNTLKH